MRTAVTGTYSVRAFANEHQKLGPQYISNKYKTLKVVNRQIQLYLYIRSGATGLWILSSNKQYSHSCPIEVKIFKSLKLFLFLRVETTGYQLFIAHDLNHKIRYVITNMLCKEEHAVHKWSWSNTTIRVPLILLDFLGNNSAYALFFPSTDFLYLIT